MSTANHTLETPEGIRYSPIMVVEHDRAANCVRLEVGVRVVMPSGAIHEVILVPSTESGEGYGTGNVFLYEDGESAAHLAWVDENEDDEGRDEEDI